MSFAQLNSKPKDMVPMLNLGCLRDIPTGTPVTGRKGETIQWRTCKLNWHYRRA